MLGEMLFPARGQLFSFGIILSIQVEWGVGGGFVPAGRCRYGHVKRA
jgi:hypothetical protein